ncbi:MAG: response regulator [Verrucomicrobiota bacterium]
MKIVIAEDDPVSQKILRVTLEKLGHTVVAANHGREAWEALLATKAKIIVSDWMMPEMDGLELCRKIRARPAKEYVYFIMLTARTGATNYHQAMDAGVDDFLTKPLSHEELTIRLRVAGRILEFIDQIRELKRLLPICMYCKKIRDDQDYWHQVEAYLHDHTGTDFSHSICPECYETQVKPQLKALQDEASS